MPNLLAVSSLAWDEQEEEEGFALLAASNFSATELIPARVEKRGSTYYNKLLAGHGLSAVALQAIFYGCEGLHLLRDQNAFDRLVDRVKRLATIGDKLHVPIGIFGAPTLRNFTLGEEKHQKQLGLERLHILDQVLEDHAFKIALEPVPKCYGSDFLKTSAEILECLDAIEATNLVLMQDTACIQLGSAELLSDVERNASHAVHFHVSEPQLGAFFEAEVDHSAVAQRLRQSGYGGPISIEMRRTGSEWKNALLHAMHLVEQSYGAC